METAAHQSLKRIGAAWLHEFGFQAVALEVSSPIPRHRVDVAGYMDATPLPEAARAALGEAAARGPSLFDGAALAGLDLRRRPCEPRTVILECKQSRADFLRDRKDLERLLRLRARLEERRVFLERTVVRSREPELRVAGSSLFAGGEEWAYERSREPSYLATVRRIERIEDAVYGETKFCLMARWRMADWLYVLAPRGVVQRGETPPGWGLLECAPSAVRSGAPEVTVAVAAPELGARADRRARLLRNIAVAATKQAAWRAAPSARTASRRRPAREPGAAQGGMLLPPNAPDSR